MRGAEGDLLGLGEEVVGVAVEHHPPDRRDRHQLLGDQFGRIEYVEAEGIGLSFRKYLHAQFPLRVRAGFDRVPEVAAMEIGVTARDLDRLVPQHGMRALFRRPVELNERRLAVRGHEAERMYPEALHHPVAARDRAIGHQPHQHVGRLGHQGDEVPERVVRRRGLRHAVVRLGLDRMDEVGKLHRVLDEEHRHVVPYQVPVAFVGIEFHRETAHVARGVLRSAFAGHGREADEHRRALAFFGE